MRILRSKSDAILVGKNTVEQDDPLLTVRYAKGKNPIRIILDSHGIIKNNSRIIKTCKHVPTIIVTSEIISKPNLNRLRKLPIDVIICGKNQVNLTKLLPILLKKGIKTILLEGGGTLNRSFLQKNLIDEMIIALTPYVLGSKNTVSLFEGMSFPELLQELKRMRVQMKYSREIQKESELLDAEYHQIVKMQKRGELTLFDFPESK
mgnify:CR=1 FL=1